VLVLGSAAASPPEDGVTQIQAFQLYGLSGPAVVSVDLVLTNGLRVTATLRHGVWGMWWPGDRGDPAGGKLEIRTAVGVTAADPEAVRLPIQ
jgi:hypothetical protein